MQKETEIKLRVSRETLAALREHPLLKKRNKSGWERRELMNQYFDTPERDLARAKVALRLRKDGDDIIQTLKTRGQSVAGLSERNEYNWDLPKAKLDVKKLDGECWPEELAELDKKTLKPIFTTDFVRERAEIAGPRSPEPAQKRGDLKNSPNLGGTTKRIHALSSQTRDGSAFFRTETEIHNRKEIFHHGNCDPPDPIRLHGAAACAAAAAGADDGHSAHHL